MTASSYISFLTGYAERECEQRLVTDHIGFMTDAIDRRDYVSLKFHYEAAAIIQDRLLTGEPEKLRLKAAMTIADGLLQGHYRSIEDTVDD